MNLNGYHEFYGDELVRYSPDLEILQLIKLEDDKKMLTKYGIPADTPAGFDVLTGPLLFEESYLVLYCKRELYICIDLRNSEIVYWSDTQGFSFIASNLVNFVETMHTYGRFIRDVLDPDLLGKYDDDPYKYVEHLRKLLEPFEPRLSHSAMWNVVLEEMGYGMY